MIFCCKNPIHAEVIVYELFGTALLVNNPVHTVVRDFTHITRSSALELFKVLASYMVLWQKYAN